MNLALLIPTHNRCTVLARTLERVARLRVPAEHRLEAVVVANACTDATMQTIAECARRCPFALRGVEEPQPGVAHARNRLLQEASGEILLWLDDDIAVEPDWLERHLEAYRSHGADLVGGKIGLWFEERQPEDWQLPALEKVLSWKDLGADVRPITNAGDLISGNFSMKRAVYEAIGAFRTDLGRKAGSLLGGEEIDFVQRALAAGFKAVYTPHAGGRHWVPAAHLEEAHLRRHAIDIGRTRVFMMERLGARRVLRRLLANPLRMAGHKLAELGCVLRGNKRAFMLHRVKRWKQLGGWWGTLQRIFGAAPKSN